MKQFALTKRYFGQYHVKPLNHTDGLWFQEKGRC